MVGSRQFDTNYILDRNEVESSRLTGQYELFKAASGRETAVPTSIDLSKVTRILDIAAGNLVWTLDVAAHPDIKSRLSPDCSSHVELYACDVSSKQFPPKSVLDSLGLKTFEHDVTVLFPQEYEESFDLVHMSMLVAALSETGWHKALINVRQILKPNGHLFIVDINSPWVHPKRPLPDSWQYRPVQPEDLDLTDWIDSVHNVILPTITDVNNFIPDLVYRLPQLLQEASMSVVSETPLLIPIGALCKSRLGPNGRDLSQFTEFTSRNFYQVFDSATRNALKTGTLRTMQRKLETEEERGEFMSMMRKGLEEEGAMRVITEIVAKKLH